MASRRGYVTQDEVAEYADITITDSAEMDDQISQAEEIIDAYVGYQERFFPGKVRGEVTAVSGRTLFDTGTGNGLGVSDNMFAGCEVEIIAGTGNGQRRTIASSDESAMSITVSTDWTTQPDTTSIFLITQPGKFPRYQDVIQNRAGTQYIKTIPEAVRRATAAQIQYMVAQGSDFFATDQLDMESETIGNYSYSKGAGNGAGQSALVKMIAPKARALLKGIKNSTGQIVAGPASWV